MAKHISSEQLHMTPLRWNALGKSVLLSVTDEECGSHQHNSTDIISVLHTSKNVSIYKSQQWLHLHHVKHSFSHKVFFNKLSNDVASWSEIMLCN